MINLSIKSDVLEVSIRTESFDLSDAKQLGQLLRAVERPVFESVRIDLSEVETIRAVAVGPLLSAGRELSAAHKPVILVQPQPAVRSLLELMKLSDAFEIQAQ